MPFDIRVNGQVHSVDCEGDTPLLYVLRHHVAVNGPKLGRGVGACGACTVIVAGGRG